MHKDQSDSDWRVVPISELYDGLFDGPHATPAPSDVGPVFLGIKNISEDGALDLSEIRHISEREYPRWTKRITPKAGDIVFSYEATLHRYALIPEGFRGCLGRRMALIRINPKKTNVKFLFYYFFSSAWRQVVQSNVLIGATVNRIPLTKFPKFQVRVPSLKTQKKIASILSAYDDLIENNKRRIALLEKMAEEIYREWFVRMRFSSFAEASDDKPGAEKVKGLPKGWRVVRVADLGKIVTGKTPPTSEQRYYGDQHHFIKTPDMHGNLFILGTGEMLSEDGFRFQKAQSIPQGSICVSCIGTGGVVSITTMECQTNQQINSVILHRSECLEWAYFTLKNLKEMIELVGGTGTTMTNLSKGKFSNLKIVMPYEGLVDRYHQVAGAMFEQIQTLGKTNQSLTKARDLLLPRLISGKLSVEKISLNPVETAEQMTSQSVEAVHA